MSIRQIILYHIFDSTNYFIPYYTNISISINVSETYNHKIYFDLLFWTFTLIFCERLRTFWKKFRFWTFLRTFRFFIYVHSYSLLFIYLQQCPLTFINPHLYSFMFIYVQLNSFLFNYIHLCFFVFIFVHFISRLKIN